MNEQYKHLSRLAFHMGLSALRLRLMSLTDSQLRLKEALRKPHTDGAWRAQSALAAGKLQITATLNVYLDVRGKAKVDKKGQPHHRVDKFDAVWYQCARDNAQHEFDQQAEIHQRAWLQSQEAVSVSD